MSSSPVLFEFSKYCPHLDCGEPLEINPAAPARFCTHCGSDITICSTCGATNRLLAVYCRGCGNHTHSEVWPMQAGLKTNEIRLGPIQTINQVQPPFPRHLGSSVLAHSIAADGIIMVPLSDGAVTLVSEFSGKVIGQIPVYEKVSVTPALNEGFLFVAVANNVYSFDLAYFLRHTTQSLPKPAWTFQAAAESITDPLLIDDRSIYVTSKSGSDLILEAVSQATGARAWPKCLLLGATNIIPPVLVGNYIIVVNQAGGGIVVDSQDGNTVQTFSLQRGPDMHVAPFVTGNRVLVADTNGGLHEIAITEAGAVGTLIYSHQARIVSLAANEEHIALGHTAGLTLLTSRGEPVWSNDSIESISVQPILAGSSIFALDDAGVGLLFDVMRANPAARVKMISSDVITPPLMTKSRIAVTSASGDLVAIGWK
jgi:ribosomal protein L40E